MSHDTLDGLLEWLHERNPHQPEFIQAAEEILEDSWELIAASDEYRAKGVLERLLEPDRVISFKVTWEDDDGGIHVNRGFRVQTCNALGPYKGGLRFHPSVNESILKFLGLEQTLKNSLTGLQIGGAKGGSDFDPKPRSDREIRRFCQSFMLELAHHIGPETDVPAGDIGVGDREIGYLFGQYKRISRSFAGALTGKPVGFGGSALRTEATGWGVVYFAQCALARADGGLAGKRCLVSGAGNVARHCAEKLLEMDCTVLSLSDSRGALIVDSGIEREHLDGLEDSGGRLCELADEFGLDYVKDAKPWQQACDIAFPCATQNELGGEDAEALVGNGCRFVVEGANMPCDPRAIALFREEGVTVCPGKAANAGGVAVSTLEMAQNASFQSWSRDRVNEELREIMQGIHRRCIAKMEGGDNDYIRAANRAGMSRVAQALAAQGI
ncbi:MAG: NADP-specific glutamate dehydrogenase [Gammaproteobacteria bacterium]